MRGSIRSISLCFDEILIVRHGAFFDTFERRGSRVKSGYDETHEDVA